MADGFDRVSDDGTFVVVACAPVPAKLDRDAVVGHKAMPVIV